MSPLATPAPVVRSDPKALHFADTRVERLDPHAARRIVVCLGQQKVAIGEGPGKGCIAFDVRYESAGIGLHLQGCGFHVLSDQLLADLVKVRSVGNGK